jgi:hypothetical protein
MNGQGRGGAGGLTQRELAAISGVQLRTIARHELACG